MAPLSNLLDSVFSKLNQPGRNLAIDYCRALAISAVVLFHFDWLPFGYLGVDLFFVISGFLVSQPLVAGFESGEKPAVAEFILRRGFKIWPSYFLFLCAGNLAASLMYSGSDPAQVISFSHLPRYFFFYLNYRNLSHWSFDHLWSICVEEHFYFLLPFSFLVLGALGRRGWQLPMLVAAVIGFGNLGRAFGYMVGFETYSATHNRIDALAWGVLLAILHARRPRESLGAWKSAGLLTAGLSISLGAVTLHASGSEFYRKAVFHGLVPAGIFFCLWPLLTVKLPKLRPIQLLAYGSYNWYLWHPLFVIQTKAVLGTGFGALCVYMVGTFVLGLGLTAMIEDPALRLRDRILARARNEAPATGTQKLAA